MQYNTSADSDDGGGGGDVSGGAAMQNALVVPSDLENAMDQQQLQQMQMQMQNGAVVPAPGPMRSVKDDVDFMEEARNGRQDRDRLQMLADGDAPAQPPRRRVAGPYVPPRRLVHLDLKGAPPKLQYLQKLFPLVRKFGATGLLLEWEDMFPWTGPLAQLAADNAYSKADVKEILKMAAANQLEVIPLIQTFGHVEFALKLPDFAHLREVQESPQALCPSNNASVNFVEQLIDQVR